MDVRGIVEVVSWMGAFRLESPDWSTVAAATPTPRGEGTSRCGASKNDTTLRYIHCIETDSGQAS